MTIELKSRPKTKADKVTNLRVAKCSLDSRQSKAMLRRNGIALTKYQVDMFRAIETTWQVEVLNADTGGCLIHGRFNQEAVNGYFFSLRAVHDLGRDASIKEIVAKLASLHPNGLAFVLFAAAVCVVYSDWIAREAYRQIAEAGGWEGDPAMEEAIKEYRDRIGLVDEICRKAAISSGG